MVTRVSSSGVNLSTLLSIQHNKQTLDTVTTRLTTGYKFERFQDYGTDAKRIVDFKNLINEHSGYVRSIGLVEPIASAYEEALAHMSEMATLVMQASDPLSVKREEFPGETDTMARSAMIDLSANLNIEIGGRYIFAGTNYTETPVRDLREMELYNIFNLNTVDKMIEDGILTSANYVAPELDADGNYQFDGAGNLIVGEPIPLGTQDEIEQANIIPQSKYLRPVLDDDGQLQYDVDGNVILEEATQSYHEKFAGDQTENERSWQRMTITLNERQPYEYSIAATEKPFQLMAEALLRMRSSTQELITAESFPPGQAPNQAEIEDLNWERQREFLREAYNLAEEARLEIRKLEVRNGAVINQLNTSREFHDRYITLSHVSQDKLDIADENEAAIQLSALNHMIEASFTAIAKRTQLTLTNFLR